MSDEYREPARPRPPKVNEPRCDICGKHEDDCRRIPPSTSSHTYTPARRLHVVDKRHE